MEVSAGPPSGGLYLMPPSSGGLCDGVITMPSASPWFRPRLCVRMACEMTGVGTGPPPSDTTTSTPLATSTSSAVRSAGPESACVSAPRKSGPVDARLLAVLADGLGDRQDVGLVEAAPQRRAAVAGGAEGDALGRVARIGLLRGVPAQQVGHVDQEFAGGGLAGEGMDHARSVARSPVLRQGSRQGLSRPGAGRKMGRMLPAALVAALLTAGPGIPDSGWRTLEPGLEVGLFDGPPGAPGDGKIAVVRIDPGIFELRLLNSSAPGQGVPASARAWADRAGASAVINASMYQEDYRTAVSLMRTREHVNQRRISRDRAALVFDPLDGKLPPVRMVDRDCDDLGTATRSYGTVIQSIRMVSCERRNVWAPSQRRSSVAAVGLDGHGRVLFLHARSAWPVHELVNALLELAHRPAPGHVRGGRSGGAALRARGGRGARAAGRVRGRPGRRQERLAAAERDRGRPADALAGAVRRFHHACRSRCSSR